MKKHTKYEDMDIINVDEYEDIIDILLNRLLNTEKTVGIVVNKEFAEYITSILLKIPETSIKEIDFIDWYNINEYLVYINNDGYVTAIQKQQKKPKRWNIGFQTGFGFQYGMFNKTIDVGPYLGVGVSWGFGF